MEETNTETTSEATESSDEVTIESLQAQLEKESAKSSEFESKYNKEKKDNMSSRAKKKEITEKEAIASAQLEAFNAKLDILKPFLGVADGADVFDKVQELVVGEKDSDKAQLSSRLMEAGQEKAKLEKKVNELAPFEGLYKEQLALNRNIQMDQVMLDAANESGVDPKHTKQFLAVAKDILPIEYDADQNRFFTLDDDATPASTLTDAVKELALSDNFSIYRSKQVTGLNSKANSGAPGNSVYDPDNHDSKRYKTDPDYRKAAEKFRWAQDN